METLNLIIICITVFVIMAVACTTIEKVIRIMYQIPEDHINCDNVKCILHPGEEDE